MAINPDIRDQAYQFFVEEAPELLQAIEAGLLALNQERSTAQIHNLMRSAHSIKGGASSVGLDAIATLAHRLENIFKALYSDTLEINIELEDQLFRAYDCLRLPLTEQITVGSFNIEQALATAAPIFDQLEAHCGDAIIQTQTYIPSSSELGVDMVASIFEVDVAEGLNRLAAIVAQPQDYEVAGELRAQVEVFSGFAELLALPEFGAIAATVQQALDLHPHLALEITQLAIADFETSRQSVLKGGTGDGDQTTVPSAALIELASAIATPELDHSDQDAVERLFDDRFAQDAEISQSFFVAEPMPEEASENAEDTLSLFENLEDIFGDFTTDIDLAEDTFDVGSMIEEVSISSEFANQNLQPDNYNITALEDGLDIEADINDAIELDSIPKISTEIGIGIDTEALTQSKAKQTEVKQDVIEIEGELVSEAIATEWVSGFDLLQPMIPSSEPGGAIQIRQSAEISYSAQNKATQQYSSYANEVPAVANLTVRVDSSRLGKMNNLVGELAINRDALSLQNEQLQGVVRELLSRFGRFQTMVGQLQEISDQMLIAPERYSIAAASGTGKAMEDFDRPFALAYRAVSSTVAEFDSLEMDRYGALHPQIQEILENMVQLEETVDDIALFARQSDQMLDQQRNRLSQLQDEVIWARMLPLGEVLNRFPRMLRDLATAYRKPVQLKLVGAAVLIEKAILEKLYDPLLHLLRNAFDHGIETISLRQERGKPEQGQIEVRAYHRGNQTVIEVRDDGQGLNLERIRRRALEQGLLTSNQLLTATPDQLYELIFEPGFSTADRLSELSGRGVGLDVVRSQLLSIKGKVAVASFPGRGTTFTLYLPLTLTITRLIICLVNSAALALPADSVEEILTPQIDQIKQSGGQRFLYWREQIVPTYRLSELLTYACPLPDVALSKALVTVPSPQSWAAPLLILQQEQQIFALEVDRLVTEQELVIKSFGSAIASPNYAYGCTILGDGSLVPVIDPNALLSFNLEQAKAAARAAAQTRTVSTLDLARSDRPTSAVPAIPAPTILVVDDAVTLRRTLALSLERAGFRVLQARDGREAIAQVQKSLSVQLIVCDVEMPNMNGFEFLSHRRQDPELSEVPVVMLTSRSHEKHRWLAIQLGATAYFTKPYLEQEFLAALTKILHSNNPKLQN